MFEIGQLRSFIAVATELHFGRAAERLNISQPPLSRQIQALEREIGVELLKRSSRTVQLTSAGRAFLAEARALMLQAEAAGHAARRAVGIQSGSVAIGFIGAATYSAVPRLIARARDQLPKVDLVIKELLTVDQIDALASRRIDIGLVRLPLEHRGLDKLLVQSEPLMLAVRRGERLATKRALRLADLDRQPYVMYSPHDGWYLHEMLTLLFREAGILPDYVLHASQTHAILSMVSAGVGAALVPSSAQNACFANVVLRPLPLPPNLRVRLHAVWRRDNGNAAVPPVRELLACLFEQET
ncbi:LysR family transcriptional regulator [Humitalea sp. 24SJ18S-53]|uniref:LysR family transcriptional regulator n=1 Tax=Humitalea sp. 24SJ18S-53 TaxID=3422307 RepID=UPI003D6721E2